MNEWDKIKIRKLIEEYDEFIQNWDFKFYEELSEEDELRFKNLLKLMDNEISAFCEENNIY